MIYMPYQTWPIVVMGMLISIRSLGDEPKPTINQRVLTSVGIEFVVIQGGTFKISQRENLVDNASKEGFKDSTVEVHQFMMSSTEISVRQWKNIAGSRSIERVLGRAPEENDLNRPVVGVNYFDMIKFCELLSKRLEADDAMVGKAFLPTEAQWEYVAQAGGTKGENIRSVLVTDPVVWECGSGAKNKFGIYDMLGNVSEICRDVFVSSRPTGVNPKTVAVEDVAELRFVLRGGSYLKDSSVGKRSVPE